MSRGIIEGEPDYEAALAEFLKLAWAKDGLGPYAEELKPEVLPNGVTVPVISTFEKAQRIVDAAIAGRVLSAPSPDMIKQVREALEVWESYLAGIHNCDLDEPQAVAILHINEAARGWVALWGDET